MMKRTFALFLCLVMMLSIVACGTEPKETLTLDIKTEETKEENTDKKTEEKTEETKEVVFATIEDPMTPEDLANIPIANSSMTTDELRQICLDFVELQVSFPWMCSETHNYVVTNQGYPVTYEAGVIYAGIPYVNVASGNVYRWMEFYDPETGIVDFTYSFASNNTLFGTACSGTACWGWGRVVNSAQYSFTPNMTLKNGFIPVGDYQYDPEIFRYDEDGFPSCKKIATDNGEQVMYASYAKTLPADCLVKDGHVRMCASKPVVVYKEGTNEIDGKNSYLTFHDQGMYRDQDFQMRTQSDGTRYSIQGSVNVKMTFLEMFSAGYLPHTFAEFLGTDPVEDASVTLGLSGDTVSISDLAAATLESNYAISDIFFSVKDEDGKEIYNRIVRAQSHYKYNWKFSSLQIPTVFTKYANGKNTIEISVQVSNGTKPVAYSGVLI